MEWIVWPTKHAGARELESKLEDMIEGSFKHFLGGTTQVDADERTETHHRNPQRKQRNSEFYSRDLYVGQNEDDQQALNCSTESKEIQQILDEVIKNQQRIKQQIQGRKTTARTPVSTPSKPSDAQSTLYINKSNDGGNTGHMSLVISQPFHPMNE